MLTASNIVRISSAAVPKFGQLSQESAPRLTCEARLFMDSLGSNAPSCVGGRLGDLTSSAHVSNLRAKQRAADSEATFPRGDCAVSNIGARYPVKLQVIILQRTNAAY